MDKSFSVFQEKEDLFLLVYQGFCADMYTKVNNLPDGCLLRFRNAGLGSALEVRRYEDLLLVIDVLQANGYKPTSRVTHALFWLHKRRPEATPSITARDYQREDSDVILLKKRRVILASECGVGKTMTAILVGIKVPGRKVIIAPVSLLLNWQAEIRAVDPKATIVVQPKMPLYGEEWVIVSYDYLANHGNVFTANPAMAIVDEAHILRSVDKDGAPSTARGRAVMTLTQRVQYLILLTATPAPSYRREMFFLLCCVNADSITGGKNYEYFKRKFCLRVGEGVTDYNGMSLSDIFRRELSKYMIRRLRKDVLPGLDMVRYFIPVHIEESLRKASFIEHTEFRSSIAKQKVLFTVDLIESLLLREHAIIVFSCFVEVLASIQRILEEKGVSCDILRGDMAIHEREKVVEKFNERKVTVLAVSFSLGNVGLNLQRASCTVFNDFDYIPSNWIQAESRTSRLGQNESCTYYYVYAENSAIENRLFTIIKEKLASILHREEEKTFLHELSGEVQKLLDQ